MNINRSTFIKLGGMVALGVASIPALFTSCKETHSHEHDACCAVDYEQKLKELGFVLPPAPKPLGVYQPTLVSGNLLYVSGQTPRTSDGTLITGKVGADLNLEEGKLAARQAGLTMISVIKNHFGDLNRICRLVKTFGVVNSAWDFYDQPAVINGFSEVMAEIFGEEYGMGTRSAIGGVLPSNMAVEIEAIFELRC